LGEGLAGAVEGGLDVARVAEVVAEEVIVGIAGVGLEGEGEAGVGIFGEGFARGVASSFEIVDDFLEEHFLEADFDLLGADGAPGVGGELGDQVALVSGLGGEVLKKAIAESFEVGGGFEGEDGEFGGEPVGDGVEAGIGFAGGGPGAGGFLGVALVGGALRFGDGSWHGFRVAWGGWIFIFWAGRVWR